MGLNDKLPSWMTFNSESRQFSGMGPKETQIYNISLFASDTINDPVSDVISFLFSSIPSINNGQIENQFLIVGNSFLMNVPSSVFLNL